MGSVAGDDGRGWLAGINDRGSEVVGVTGREKNEISPRAKLALGRVSF